MTGMVIDEDRILRGYSELFGREVEDFGIGLAHTDLAGDDESVEQGLQPVGRVVVDTPRVREKTGLEAGSLHGGHRVEHVLFEAEPTKDPAHQALRRDFLAGQLAESLCEVGSEFGLGYLPGLESGHEIVALARVRTEGRSGEMLEFDPLGIRERDHRVL